MVKMVKIVTKEENNKNTLNPNNNTPIQNQNQKSKSIIKIKIKIKITKADSKNQMSYEDLLQQLDT